MRLPQLQRLGPCAQKTSRASSKFQDFLFHSSDRRLILEFTNLRSQPIRVPTKTNRNALVMTTKPNTTSDMPPSEYKKGFHPNGSQIFHVGHDATRHSMAAASI